jgi:hypothetical protein
MQTVQPATPNAIQELRRDEFLVSTDTALLDLDVIHGFLTTSYWAKGIPRELVAQSIEHSLCFGVYDVGGPENRAPVQVGFARAISDYSTYAYVADVFVLESQRGRGLGKLLMECIRRHPRLQNLRRWSLSTLDAHGLYAQFGFTPLNFPDRYMEILDLNRYKKA